MRQHWTLDPGVSFLNHGSYGACPRPVLEEQARLRNRMEEEPVRFMLRELEPLLDRAAAALGQFLGADPADLAFVANATSGVNAVLRSLQFTRGDEILTTDHLYPACRNALDYVALRCGARVVVARVPFPLQEEKEIFEPIIAAAGPRVRLAVLDHVTSATALVWPIAGLVAALAERGIDTLVDGAHAPGMLPVDLRKLGAAYYAGNCHKWLCAPKGAGFLHARRDRQGGLVPTSISHGVTSSRKDRSRFRLAFDWTGTSDPTPALCVPAALEFMGSLLPGGWPAVMQANHALALQARELLCGGLGVSAAPAGLLGSMVSVALPGPPPFPEVLIDPLQETLWREQRIEVPITPWGGVRLLRVSTQIYNTRGELEKLASCLSA